MRLDFCFDPACPWTWITSRWVVDVAPRRDLDVRWHTFSLAINNGLLDDDGPDVPEQIRQGAIAGLRALRVVEAVQAVQRADEAAVGRLYTELGQRTFHHTGDADDLEAVLAVVGLDAAHASAADDEARDETIRASMEEGKALVGDDVGVPILGFPTGDGTKGFFGPIISPAPTGEDAVGLFDAVQASVAIPGFFELKRSRDTGPQFPPTP